MLNKPTTFRRQIRQLVLVTCLAAWLTGCSSPSPRMYYWGEYQDVLYQDLVREDASLEQLIAKLEKTVAQAESSNQAIAPGVHAQLGKLYFEAGEADKGLQQWQLEQQLFPESAVFFKQLLKNYKPK